VAVLWELCLSNNIFLTGHSRILTIILREGLNSSTAFVSIIRTWQATWIAQWRWRELLTNDKMATVCIALRHDVFSCVFLLRFAGLSFRSLKITLRALLPVRLKDQICVSCRNRSVRCQSVVRPSSYLDHRIQCWRQSPAISVINSRLSQWVDNTCGVTRKSKQWQPFLGKYGCRPAFYCSDDIPVQFPVHLVCYHSGCSIMTCMQSDVSSATSSVSENKCVVFNSCNATHTQ